MVIFWISVAILMAWLAKRYLIIKTSKPSNAPAPVTSSVTRPADAIESSGDCDEIEIKGESNYQAALISLFGAYTEEGRSEYCGAELVREPTNQYDKYAIRCEIGGQLVGYVNKSEAKHISTYLLKKKLLKMAVNTQVRGGWRRSSKDQGNYGVTVELSPDILGT